MRASLLDGARRGHRAGLEGLSHLQGPRHEGGRDRIKISNGRSENRVQAVIKKQSATFIELAHDIHEHLELAFAEARAAERLTQVLEQEGFTIRTGIGDLATAFAATTGDGPLHLGFCAEYDALDEGSIMAAATTSSPAQRSPPPSASNRSQLSLG
jgi:hypothetical protein